MSVSALSVSMALAFIVGFAIQRGRVCCVAAARYIVEHRRPQRTWAYLLVACWSAVVVLPVAWWLPEHANLSPGYPVVLRSAAAAAVYGAGAYINNACAFGTLTDLTRGQLGYLATVGGMVTGAVVVLATQSAEAGAANPPAPILAEPTWAAFTVWVLAFILVIRAMARHYRASRNRVGAWRELLGATRWRPATSMAVLGVAGGLLYATAGKWTYLSVLSDRSAALVRMSDAGPGFGSLVVAAALVAGGVLAARLTGRFSWQFAPRGILLRRFAGGALMSGAAAIVPGGNDALLLYGLPSAAPYAIVGYTVMILSLCALIQAARWLQPRFIRPTAAGKGR